MINRLILLLATMMFMPLQGIENGEMLQKADKHYLEGEKALTIVERQNAFNQALTNYKILEDLYHPEYGNGKLYYNIANTYFQLDEYPWAIYNYYKALKLMPGDEDAKENLSIALQKAGLPQTTLLTLFEGTFYFHNMFSLPERIQIFFVLALILVFFGSLSIWMPAAWQKKAMIITAICCAIMLISLGYSLYFSPIEGVMVQSSILHKDAGEQYTPVSDQPILPGNKVQVVAIEGDGKWLKIITPNGELGYVPYTAIRVI